MKYLWLAMLVSMAYGAEEVVILDGKPVPRSALRNVEGESAPVQRSGVVLYVAEGCLPCAQLKIRMLKLGILFTLSLSDGTVPACVVYKDGKAISQFVGLRTEEELKLFFGIK